MLNNVRKIFDCQASFKMLLSMWLVIVEKKIKHSCDKVSFRTTLLKKYHNSDESRSHPNVLCYRRFYTKKIKMKTRGTIASSFHSKTGILKTWKSYFSLVLVIKFSITSSCLGKVEVFSNLT